MLRGGFTVDQLRQIADGAKQWLPGWTGGHLGGRNENTAFNAEFKRHPWRYRVLPSGVVTPSEAEKARAKVRREMARGMVPKRKRQGTVPGRPSKIPKSLQGYVRTGGFYGRMGSAGGEKKFDDYYSSEQDLTNGTSMSVLDLASMHTIAQGTGESDRVGRYIYLHEWHLKMIVFRTDRNAAPASDLEGDYARVMVYLDKQNNGGSPPYTTAQLLDSTTVVHPALAFRNLEDTSRYLVYRDFLLSLDTFSPNISIGGTDYIVNGQMKILNVHIKFRKPLKIEYSGTTGVAAEIRSNLPMIAFGNYEGAGHSTFRVASRIRYKDG
jgi:hypothetical protein